MIRLLTPWPALLIEEEERILMASDLHLGVEYELAKMGINIPYQTDRILGELLTIVREHKPDRLILLGDIKHGVPITSFQERREIPLFFSALLEAAESLAASAGEVTLRSFGGVLASDWKGDGTPVTAADRAAEKHLREKIGSRFPDHGILGEEFGEACKATNEFAFGSGSLREYRTELTHVAAVAVGRFDPDDPSPCFRNEEARKRQ